MSGGTGGAGWGGAKPIGNTVYAILFAELYFLVTGVGDLFSKFSVIDKIDKLYELRTKVAFSQKLSAAQQSNLESQIMKSINRLSKRLEEIEESLSENVLIKIGEWLEENFPSTPANPTKW